MREQADYMRRGLRISIRSARAAKRSAEAAKATAESFMRGERAWLLIDRVEPVEADFANQGTPLFFYWVVNRGKTPAFLISAKAYVQWEGSREFPGDSEFMQFSGSATEDFVITPDAKPLRLLGNDLTMGDQRFYLSEVPVEQRAGLFASEPIAYLWAVGSIHYHDVFGTIHSTPFAYWYDSHNLEFVRSNWPESNKPI